MFYLKYYIFIMIFFSIKLINTYIYHISIMKITISGTPGSGKSTVGKLLAKRLNYKHFSTGDFMRAMAEERDISLLELSKLAESDKSIDKELDERQIKLGKKENNFIIDSRLGFNFIPDSLKIFLDADLNERARRIFNDQIRKEVHTDLEDTKKNIKTREESERQRYKEYYKLDPWDKSNYDLILDATSIKPDEVVDQIITFIKKTNNKL